MAGGRIASELLWTGVVPTKWHHWLAAVAVAAAAAGGSPGSMGHWDLCFAATREACREAKWTSRSARGLKRNKDQPWLVLVS